MTENDLKKFQSIVRSEIDGAVLPIKQELIKFSKDLGLVKTGLGSVKKDLGLVKTELGSVKKILATHDRKLDALVVEVHDLHALTGAIWDQISVNDVKTLRDLDEIRTHINLPRN